MTECSEFSRAEQEIASSCREFAVAKLAPLDAQIDRDAAIPDAALCMGLAQAAFDAAKAYALERRQFGSPPSEIQTIQLKIFEMAARLDTARMLVYRAARLVDEGRRSDREASMAKFWAADTAFFVANEAVQIFGGIGCTDEAPVERYLRDARIFAIGEGTGEIHRLVVARREFELARQARADGRLPDFSRLAGAGSR